MADLEKLAMKHAHWARVHRKATRLGSASSSLCELDSSENINCIERCYAIVKDEQKSEGYYGRSFNEVWDDEVAVGKVCQRCADVRRLKRVRSYAGRKLGQLRSALTKAGDHLLSNYVDKSEFDDNILNVIARIDKELSRG